jgi:hypothetical protein
VLFRRKIGKHALIKKKCKFVVLAIDSKLAIGRRTRDKENIDLLIRLGINSEEARNKIKVIQESIKVLKRKIVWAAFSRGNKAATLPPLRQTTSK